MKISLFFVSILFIGAIYSSDVVDLSSENFNQVLESEVPFMVEFFAPWCGHCKNLAPTWEKVASNLKGIIPFGKVDCTVQQNLCQQYEVKGYPTIKCFAKKGKFIEDYKAARDARSIMSFATELLENLVIKVTASDEDNFWDTKSSQPHVILFSTKGETTPLFKSLALRYKNKLVFGRVLNTESDIVTRYNVDNFPAIMVFKNKEDTTPIKFEDTISPENLLSFFQTIADTVESSDDEEVKPKKILVPLFKKVSSDELDKYCEGRICVVGFVDSEEGEVVETHKAVLEEVLNKFKKDNKFSFVWLDKTESADIIEKFSLTTGEPSLIIYNVKRKRYLPSPSFDIKDIVTIVERVLTGDAVYKNL